jgi:hypothetical protein
LLASMVQAQYLHGVASKATTRRLVASSAAFRFGAIAGG